MARVEKSDLLKRATDELGLEDGGVLGVMDLLRMDVRFKISPELFVDMVNFGGTQFYHGPEFMGMSGGLYEYRLRYGPSESEVNLPSGCSGGRDMVFCTYLERELVNIWDA